MSIFRYLRTDSNGVSSKKRRYGRRGSRTRQAASRTVCTFDHLEPRLAMAGDIGSLLPPPALIAANTATPVGYSFVSFADNGTRLAAPLSNSTITYGFNSEDVINANWTVAGEWRIESTGIRLFGAQANLVSKQTFGPSVQKITFSYAITDNTQMWATLWGETFRLDPPGGGGQITATIERSGNAVTFSNGISTPVTVILKQANTETPTTLLIQMDQRNLWRPVMQLLVQSVVVTQNAASLPTAPTGLNAIPGDREARLQWTSPAGTGGTPITDYVVQYSTNNGGSWTTVVDGVSSATSATVTGLTNGTSYVFRVAAVNSQGTGLFSDRAANSRPARWVLASSQSNPEANDGAWTYDAATKIWSERRSNGSLFATYRELSRNAEYVELRDDSRAFTLRLSATSATWKTDSSPQWYTLGNGAWTEGPFTVTPATAPSSPSGVGGLTYPGRILLLWMPPNSNGGSAITDYTVQYSSNGGATWTTFADGISTQRLTTVTGLTNGTGYVFRVAATNAVGTSVYSEISPAFTPTVPFSVPTAPTSVMPTIGNGRVTIRWNPPASNGGSAITRYVVQYSANGGSTWLNATIPASTRTTASVLNLTNGVSYVFRVAAVNASGTGPFSTASASATPVAGTRTTIDLAPFANRRLQSVGSGAVGRLPEGNVVLGGVNFAIPVGGNNIWTGAAAAGANPRILEVPVNAAGVTRVHTLINTLWGERDAGARASITFFGSAGAQYTVELDGNNHIRDYLWNTWTNTINGTTTRNVFLAGSGQGTAPGNQVRLDMQTFTLPAAFATQTLTRIRIADWGGTNYQRLMVSGITVQ